MALEKVYYNTDDSFIILPNGQRGNFKTYFVKSRDFGKCSKIYDLIVKKAEKAGATKVIFKKRPSILDERVVEWNGATEHEFQFIMRCVFVMENNVVDFITPYYHREGSRVAIV